MSSADTRSGGAGDADSAAAGSEQRASGEKAETQLDGTGRMEVQGHRAYGSTNARGIPENSRRAFEAAGADPNVESVEFDVRLTRDGVLVVSHGSGTPKSKAEAALTDVDLPVVIISP